MNLPGIGQANEVRLLHQPGQQLVSDRLVSHDERLALALLPAVAVRRGGGAFQFAIVPLVTHPGALRTTAQGAGQAAGSALEYVLVDVLGPRPGEAAGVVAAQHVKGGVVRVGALGEDHLFAFLGSAQFYDSLEQLQGGGVTSRRHSQHEGGLSLGVPTNEFTSCSLFFKY